MSTVHPSDRSKDMSANSPHTGVLLPCQPLVAQMLRVVIMHLERAVMHVCSRISRHEERVVVDRVRAAVNVHENGYLFSATTVDRVGFAIRVCTGVWRRDIEEVSGREIEVPRIPLDLLFEIQHAQPVVPKLVHCSRTRRKAVELAYARFIFGCFEVVDNFLWVLALRSRLLPIHKIHGEALGIDRS